MQFCPTCGDQEPGGPCPKPTCLDAAALAERAPQRVLVPEGGGTPLDLASFLAQRVALWNDLDSATRAGEELATIVRTNGGSGPVKALAPFAGEPAEELAVVHSNIGRASQLIESTKSEIAGHEAGIAAIKRRNAMIVWAILVGILIVVIIIVKLAS